jgi:sugar/nucleoside kinase (ribokinase family)
MPEPSVAGRALVIGDACVDLTVPMPDRRASEMDHRRPELHGGGTGANTAVALARLGVKTAFVGAFGDDAYGHFAREALEAEGVNTEYAPVLPSRFTTIVLALIHADGERVLFGWPRRGAAHGQLAPGHLQPDAIAGSAWLHTSGMTLTESPVRETVLRAMSLAKSAGIPVSFDLNLRGGVEAGRLPADFLAVIREAVTLADVVFGSAAEEIAQLEPAPSLEESARRLTAGRRTVIARLGAQGALAVTPDGMTQTAAAYPVAVVDTVGAGDAFNAGYIAASLLGAVPAMALLWGNAVAALKVSRPGARNVPYRAEVLALLGGSATAQ